MNLTLHQNPFKIRTIMIGRIQTCGVPSSTFLMLLCILYQTHTQAVLTLMYQSPESQSRFGILLGL